MLTAEARRQSLASKAKIAIETKDVKNYSID